jgi:hypothetical protein
MRPVIAISAAFVISALVLIAGCASTSAPAPAVTIITPQPTAVPATAVPAATPGVMTIATTTTSSGDNGAIEVMPSAQQVNLVLSKDRPTSQIHLIYQGGPGEMFTQKVSMKVYASDGTVEEYTMSGGQKPLPNDEIVATGTRSGDRCVVYVQSAGTTYKLMDETVYSAGEYRV